MTTKLHFYMLVIFLMGVQATVNAQNALLSNPTTGSVSSQSAINDFEFIYDGTDLVLAITGYTAPTSFVYFVDWNSSTSTNVNDWNANQVPNIKATFASMTGASATNIETWNMEVNPKTEAVYILFYNNNTNNTSLVEVKSGSDISIVDLTSVSYSAIEYSDVSDFMMDIQVGNDQKLYGCVLDDAQTLDATVGLFTPPFAHNSTMEGRPTTVFKSNWGGNYVTWAPLEKICFATVDGTDRLMGVTTCAPGFSIDVQDIYDSGSVLQVTEDFNVRNDPSKKVVALTQTDGSETTTYLYDLHDNFSIPTQLVRVGEKYLNGSQVTAGDFNNPAQELRTNAGALTAGLTEEEVSIVANGYEMIAKWTNEYNLMVIDDNDVLRLHDVTSASLVMDEAGESNRPFSIYPNPTSADLQISFDKIATNELIVRVNDITGKLIQENQFMNDQSILQLDLSSLQAGSYTVSILSTEMELIGTKKFIKK